MLLPTKWRTELYHSDWEKLYLGTLEISLTHTQVKLHCLVLVWPLGCFRFLIFCKEENIILNEVTYENSQKWLSIYLNILYVYISICIFHYLTIASLTLSAWGEYLRKKEKMNNKKKKETHVLWRIGVCVKPSWNMSCKLHTRRTVLNVIAGPSTFKSSLCKRKRGKEKPLNGACLDLWLPSLFFFLNILKEEFDSLKLFQNLIYFSFC